MKVLERNHISPNWLTCYVGFKKKWLDENDVMEFAFKHWRDEELQNSIVKLEITKSDSPEEFLKTLEEVVIHVYGKKISEEDPSWENQLRLWQLGLLMDIQANPGLSIKDKNSKVAELWSDLGYPKDWEKFIYYMPQSNTINDTKAGDEWTYKRLGEFIEMEKKILLEDR
ncbi:DUF2247 family protein [candidate division KSB1 bacterium]|nr:DUF2247 family protein [candidate division KSB1 bacterium]